MSRIFVDMDGVVVDFDGYRANVEREYIRKHPEKEFSYGSPEFPMVKNIQGAYLHMEPMPGAVEALHTLIGMGFDVWLATRPPVDKPQAVADKTQWVHDHADFLRKKIITTQDKSILGCESDYLIDDRIHKANCKLFPGTLLEFGEHAYNWDNLLEFFREVVRQENIRRYFPKMIQVKDPASPDHLKIIRVESPDALPAPGTFIIIETKVK